MSSVASTRPITPPPTAEPSPSNRRPVQTPPEWAIERLVKKIGKIPAALGRTLDGLAKIPLLGAVVRFFSSVWVGISILFLIGCYVALGSGFASLRAHFEVTDLQFFDAWPMRILLVLLATDLIVVTLRRIPLTLFKLGPWTVHVGILTLISGCVWYFSHKQEGSVRIYLNKSVNYCYDVTERALYAFPVKSDGSVDAEHPVITPLPSLPIYNEHIAEMGNPLDITLPQGALPGTDATMHITGYYPAATLRLADIRPGKPGEAGKGPAIAVFLKSARDDFGQSWLLANSPAGRVLDMNLPFSLEYLYHPDSQRLKDLQASFDGPIGLTVRIPKLNIERTYVVKLGTPIAVEGSPYTLTPGETGGMPMLSKGYENAFSSTLMVDVSRKGEGPGSASFDFQRMCVFRYPERSPDFVGGARKQDGVDPEIQLVFHDASVTQAWVVEGENGKFSLVVRTPDGKSTTKALDKAPVEIPVKEVPGLQVAVAQRTDNAITVMAPAIVPAEQRPRGQTVMEVMQWSMIDAEISRGSWSVEHVYVPFSAYAQIGDPPIGQQPAIVDVPGGGKAALLLATTRRALPSMITLAKFEPTKYPGAVHSYSDYSSTITAQDQGAAQTHTLVTHLNNPAADHGLYYFQSAWDGDDHAPPEKRFSVIGVANRPGIPVMVIGAALIVLGIGYAFYVKPILLKAKKESLVAWNAARTQSPPPLPRTKQEGAKDTQ